MTHGVLLQVAYDGTRFHGWASQPNARTVEDVLRGAICALDAHASDPRGASRTDAGVHAEGQMVAFDATLDIPPRGWVLAINRHLPDDVCVRTARSVPCRYNPRFASQGKRYRYDLLLDPVRDPLLRDRAWRIGWPLDLVRMSAEASHIEGTHDFAAFRSAHDTRQDTVRTMKRCVVERRSERLASIVIEGNAFMHNMVRILVGTLVDVGRGRAPVGAIARALSTGARSDAGMTAPAHGLMLEAQFLGLPEGAGLPWPQ
jgi:tRNA pseudouridine38-40 synthase